MPIPEEVDEIDAYLHLRKQRQEKGELPKPSYTPPFVKKFGAALFGKKAPPKPTLTSTQPTNASPEAQAAMRKQLKEVIDSRASPVIPTPTPMTAVSPRGEPEKPPALKTPLVKMSTPAPVSVEGHAPYVPPWTNKEPAPPQTVANPRAGLPLSPSRESPRISTESMFQRFTSFFSKPKRTASPPAQSLSSASAQPPRAPSAPREVAKADLQPVVPLGSVARQPGYVPIEGVRGMNALYSKREAKVIEPVERGAALNPRRTELPRGESPRYELAASPRPPAPAMNAPPWVRRMNAAAPPASPAPGSIRDVMENGTLKDLPWISAKEAARQQAYENYRLAHSARAKPRDPSPAAPGEKEPYAIGSTSTRFNSLAKQAGVTPVAAEKRSPLPARLKPWVSGEVHLEDEEKPAEKKEVEPASLPPRENEGDKTDALTAAHEEELSEEEALEQLPFGDVEGLSDSDLDYLERKEREHTLQRKKLEEDYVAPADLKEQLQQQTIRMAAVMKEAPPAPAGDQSAVPPTTDEKQAILRRLKKMMEENESTPPSQN